MSSFLLLVASLFLVVRPGAPSSVRVAFRFCQLEGCPYCSWCCQARRLRIFKVRSLQTLLTGQPPLPAMFFRQPKRWPEALGGLGMLTVSGFPSMPPREPQPLPLRIL